MASLILTFFPCFQNEGVNDSAAAPHTDSEGDSGAGDGAHVGAAPADPAVTSFMNEVLDSVVTQVELRSRKEEGDETGIKDN